MSRRARVLRFAAITAAVGITIRRNGPFLTERGRCLMGDTPVHPDLRMVAALAPRRIVTPRTLSLLPRGKTLGPRTDGVEVVELGDGVSVRVHRPPTLRTPAPALLWMHGGGYVIGSAQQDDRRCRQFARELGIVVAAVDYRLAPEYPYPVPLEDCYTALRWLSSRTDIDPTRIAIGGSSAGGGLAAALALTARDRGEIEPVLQLLMYPMLDDRTVARTDLETRHMRLWSPACNRFGWWSYLGDASPTAAVPARRTELAGLPPAWIGVGDLDLFHDEDIAYAERLREAGVPCETVVVPGAFHGFYEVAPTAGVTRSVFAGQCASLRKALFD